MQRPSLIFRISRFITFLLKGVGKKEEEHYLFTMAEAMLGEYLFSLLADYGWQPNYMGYVYKGQVYQCRKLLDHGEHQYHVRFYDDGMVTGHFEVSPEYDTSDHLHGIDLRTMTPMEAEELNVQLSRGIEPTERDISN